MKISPSIKSTEYGNHPYEWLPCCFDSFLQELHHIKETGSSDEHLLIFRGHKDKRWLLDSTFIRHIKENILGVSAISKVRPDYRKSLEFHMMLGSLFLYKFGTQTEPSQELRDIAEEHPIDPWFEWMKRIQQYPDEDLGPMWGSFLIDWTQNEKVALYFANDRRSDISEGAIWIADVNSMGKVLHRDMSVLEIMQIFQDAFKNDKQFGCPLVFYPHMQIDNQRAKNQDAIYVAQMDLRYDLSEIWTHMEQKNGGDEKIFIKLVLPSGTSDKCKEWLSNNDINADFIYPDNKAPTI